MSQCEADEAFISVRIVTMDHYQGEPMEALDPFQSDRGYEIRRVPVIRVFGPTPAGQNVCLHIHGIFPYLYIPMPTSKDDGFIYRLASSIDKAINTSFNQSKSTAQHVYKALKVSGRPFYGYHPRQHNFIKLYFYSYYMLKRASDMLANGVIMDQMFQPHESHVPFELQFMMDYNLQGMNLIHLRHVVFRQGEIKDEYDDIEPFEDLKPPALIKKQSSQTLSVSPKTPTQSFIFTTPGSSGTRGMTTPAGERYFDLENLPEYLKLSEDVKKVSTSELEIDAVAADILNSNQLVEGAMNPGLKVLWEDEAERRRLLGITDPLTPPGSPPRSPAVYQSSESEKFWLQRFDTMLEEKKEREGTRDLSASFDPDSTINIGQQTLSAGSSTYAAETNEDDLQRLPAATQLESHVTTLSASLLEASSTQTSSANSFLSTSQIGTPKRNISQNSDDSDLSDDYSANTQLEETICVLEESDEELVDLLIDLGEGEEEDKNISEETEEELVDLLTDLGEHTSQKSGNEEANENDTIKEEEQDSDDEIFPPSPPQTSPIISSQRSRKSSQNSRRKSKNSQGRSQNSINNSQERSQSSQNKSQGRFENSKCSSQGRLQISPGSSQNSQERSQGRSQNSKNSSQGSSQNCQERLKNSQGSGVVTPSLDDTQPLGLCDEDIFGGEDFDDDDLITLEMTQQIWHSDPLSNPKSESHNDEEDNSDTNKDEDGNDLLDLSAWNIDDDQNESNINNEADTRHEDSENVLNSSIWSEIDDEHLVNILEISENDRQKEN